MFKQIPQIIGHISSCKNKPFIGYEYIMTKVDNTINLFNRTCPHRFYPIGEQLGPTNNITCKLHGFEYDSMGAAVNDHPFKLNCSSYNLGMSGLVFRNFAEPDHEWVACIASETNLEYSHCYTGQSNGSWLWLSELETDILHVRKDGIHPWLSSQYSNEDVKFDDKTSWVY
jgi:nitrite reductase/ring-hydroxylating ferredoxin subunit